MISKCREPVKKNQNLSQKSVRKGHYVEMLVLRRLFCWNGKNLISCAKKLFSIVK